MFAFPIALSTGCFYKKRLFDLLEPIRQNGFSALEITASIAHLDYRDLMDVREAGRQISDLGLEVCCFHGPFGLHADFTSPGAEERQSALKDILLALEAAVALNARYFILHPGPVIGHHLPLREVSRRRENAVSSLRRIAELCRATDTVLLLENMLPHQLLGRISDLLWFREAIDPEMVGLCFDTGHASLGGDLYMIAHKLAEYVRVIHAHDNLVADDHLPPGKGRIDWRRLLKVLVASGFDGLISLELSGEVDDDLKQLTEACQAREFLQEILLGMG